MENWRYPAVTGFGYDAGVTASAEPILLRRPASAQAGWPPSHARRDALTLLPNRKAGLEALSSTLAEAHRTGASAAVLLIDVSNFNVINTAFGQAAGDDVLKELARRLRASVDNADFVARSGGDEFMVIVSRAVELGRFARMPAKIREAIGKPFALRGDLVVTAEVGLAVYPDDGTTVDALLVKAHAALLRAKRERSSNDACLGPELRPSSAKQIDDAMRLAIENGEFRVLYQPIISLKEGTVVAAEALVRWPQLDGSMLPPSQFIPRAEESGLIVPLGAWILRTACIRNVQLQVATGVELRMHVNVSAKQVAEESFVQTVFDALSASGLRADLLEIELTETAMNESPERSARIVRELRNAGIRVALDDFGTGYNSLVTLRSLEIDTLKLEKCFVDNIIESAVDQAIAFSVVSAAHSIGASTVAEGVETDEQRNLVHLLGFEEMQGYQFAKPMSGESLEALLMSTSRKPV